MRPSSSPSAMWSSARKFLTRSSPRSSALRKMKTKTTMVRTTRTEAPWELYFGLKCPRGNIYHQPHPDPWWSGESVFAVEGQLLPQPVGPFYHGIIRPDWSHEILGPGDYLLSPAERRVAVPRIAARLASDGCIGYKNYDVHGVYVTTSRATMVGIDYYEVEPEGLLWPDPERIRDDWCCIRARIISVHRGVMADV